MDLGKVVVRSLCAAIGTFLQHELVLTIDYFIHGDEVVFVPELVGGWEVYVLQAVLN